MTLKIDVLCNDGSPLGVSEKSVTGEDGRIGVGGAELALITLCGAWQNYKHYDVTLYNNPVEPNPSSFEQRNIASFDPDGIRDVLIVFRSPNAAAVRSKGRKVWLSTDQRTVGDFKTFATTMDEIIVISPFHREYFKSMYGITTARVIDLPVRTWEYKDKIQKVPKRCIFTSIPDRGLKPMAAIWHQISERVPDASLAITSDWRLWAPNLSDDYVRPYRLSFANMRNVHYLSAVKRDHLIRVQMEAQVHLYPCTYDELFCISVAESQVAGAYPITSGYGALPTTNMGLVLSGNPSEPTWQTEFVKKAVEALYDPELESRIDIVKEVATNRFSIETVCHKWDEVFYG